MLSATDLGPWLHFGVLTLAALLCVALLVRTLVRPGEVYDRACCGACGHAVADILSGQCPECGARYARAGVSTPTMAARLRGSLGLALIAWTLLAAIGASRTQRWLETRAWASAVPAGGPVATGRSYSTTLTPWGAEFVTPTHDRAGVAAARDATDYRVSLALKYTGADTAESGSAESGSLELRVRRNGEALGAAFDADLADGSFVLSDGAGKELARGRDAGRPEMEAMFRAAGFDPGHKAVARGIDDLVKIVGFASKDPGAVETFFSRGFSSNTDAGALQASGGMSSYGPNVGMLAVPPGPGLRDLGLAGGVLLGAYLVGCVLIVWRHRRLLRPAAPEVVTA